MEWIICSILLIIVVYNLFSVFKPNIDIVFIDKYKYKILLWYNKRRGDIIERKWIKLFEQGKDKHDKRRNKTRNTKSP